MAEDKDWSSLLNAADDKLDSDNDSPRSDGEKLLALFAGDDSDNPLQVPSIPDNHTTALLTSPDGIAYLAEDVSVSADNSQSGADSDDDEASGWYSLDFDSMDSEITPVISDRTGSQPEFTNWDEEVARFEGKTIDITAAASEKEAAADKDDTACSEACGLMSGRSRSSDIIIPILPKIEKLSEETPTDTVPEPTPAAVQAPAAPAVKPIQGAPAAPYSQTGVLTHATSRERSSELAKNLKESPILRPAEPAAPTEGITDADINNGSRTDAPAPETDHQPETITSSAKPELPLNQELIPPIPVGDSDRYAEEDEEDDYPAFRDLSHLTHVITISCLVPVIAAWSLLAYSLYIGRENALEHTCIETKAQAEVFREHAERNIGLADEFTAHIKKRYEAGELHSYKFLEAEANQRILPYKVYITDAENRLIGGKYPGGSDAFAHLYADHFIVNKAVNSDNLYISRSLWDEWTKSWAFSASRRLNKPDGSYAGSIIFIINPQQFFDYYQREDFSDDQRIFLLGRDLVIRATRTGSYDFIDSLLHNQEVIDALKSGTSGSFTAPASIDQEPYIYSYAALNNYPLIVVSGRTKAAALSEVNQRSVYYAALALICMVSGFILWRLLLRLINRQYDTEKNLRLVQAELRQSVERRTAELVAANATLTETNNSLATLNRDLGDEIDRRRLAEEARRQAGEKLEYTAYHDAVTGLPNLAYLLNWLEKDIANEGTGILALIFVNNLDEINDAFGYEIGNELINTVAQELTNEDTGLSGAVVAHLGYGRFCIAAPGVSDADQAAVMVDIINRALAHITEIRSMLIHVTAAMGFVLYPEHGTSPTELMQNADSAVAAARTENQSGWCLYEERMKEVLRDRITLTAQLRQAITNGEFLLVYQPKTSVTTGKVVSFEALIRWHSPMLGMVRPDLFIPLAEQNGLITPIGEWVMQEGCRFAKRLQAAGWTNVTVAINVSGNQFAAEDFLDVVRNAVSSIGIPNEAIEIEITETAVISSLTQAIEKISQLRDNGIRIALDDFGVRYSTLSYLLRLPFDILKVDKSFVDTIGITDHGTDIVRMIIELAHLLGKEVVAEGVETKEQYEILAKLHCDIIQGYYFSKPLNETSAFEYLRQEEMWSN